MAKKKFFETDRFKQLKAEWDHKLTDSGFEDIESADLSEHCIVPQIFSLDSPRISGGIDYYEFCQQILREYRFKKDIHRLIFELHTEGKSERDIVRVLQETKDYKVSRRGVNDLINRTKEAFLKGAG